MMNDCRDLILTKLMVLIHPLIELLKINFTSNSAHFYHTCYLYYWYCKPNLKNIILSEFSTVGLYIRHIGKARRFSGGVVF
jgi:hypothetical protein